MRSTKLALALSAVSSLLASCGSGAPRPVILLCIVNAPAKHRLCYNASTDYNDDGTIKSGTVPVIRPNATLEDLNKAFTIDSVDAEVPASSGFVDALASFKAYLKMLKNRYANCASGN